MRFTIRRRLLVGVAATVACLPAAPAAAATYVLRPSVTYPSFSTWTTSPAGADLAGVLDDAVTRPAAPSTSGDYVQSAGAANGQWVSSYLAAPALGAGAAPTAARLYVYAQVGSVSTLTFTLWAGMQSIGYASVPAGSPAGWYSATATAPPSAAAAGHLALTLRIDAAMGATATRVYAAVAEVDTNGPPAAPAALPADTADTPPADDVVPAPVPAAPSVPSAPAAQIDVAAPLVLPAGAFALPVPLACPATVAGACRGTVVLRLAGSAPRGKSTRARARAARCARGCRVIGEGRFEVAAGKTRRVPVKIAKAARNLVAGGRAIRATAVVTTRDATGRAIVVSEPVTIRGGSQANAAS